jgi:hypothetical protein
VDVDVEIEAVAEDVEQIAAGPGPPEEKEQLEEVKRDLMRAMRKAPMLKNKNL